MNVSPEVLKVLKFKEDLPWPTFQGITLDTHVVPFESGRLDKSYKILGYPRETSYVELHVILLHCLRDGIKTFSMPDFENFKCFEVRKIVDIVKGRSLAVQVRENGSIKILYQFSFPDIVEPFIELWKFKDGYIACLADKDLVVLKNLEQELLGSLRGIFTGKTPFEERYLSGED